MKRMGINMFGNKKSNDVQQIEDVLLSLVIDDTVTDMIKFTNGYNMLFVANKYVYGAIDRCENLTDRQMEYFVISKDNIKSIDFTIKNIKDVIKYCDLNIRLSGKEYSIKFDSDTIYKINKAIKL